MALDAVIRVGDGAGAREVASGAFITDVLTTVLEPGEIVTSIRIPRLSGDAVWGHCKLCRKPGDLADALSVVVLDRARDRCRVVAAGPTLPPIYLDRTATLVAEADGWSETLAGALKATAIAEIRAAGFVDDDGYALGLHATVVVRSAREALA
jgi:carbon-monoxide dehydrogenase medium subunit